MTWVWRSPPPNLPSCCHSLHPPSISPQNSALLNKKGRQLLTSTESGTFCLIKSLPKLLNKLQKSRWENYDKMTRGDGGGEGWGRVNEDGNKMSSTFVLCLVAFLFSLSFLIMMVVVICKKWKRRRAAKVSTSRLSLPPPYEVIALLFSHLPVQK